jgi:hypothetical protein
LRDALLAVPFRVAIGLLLGVGGGGGSILAVPSRCCSWRWRRSCWRGTPPRASVR